MKLNVKPKQSLVTDWFNTVSIVGSILSFHFRGHPAASLAEFTKENLP
jgi:hypothetical protein